MDNAGSNTGEFVELGKVAKPHGIRGEVKIYPYSGQPENFLEYKIVYLALSGNSDLVPFTIKKCRVQGKFALVTFAECTTRNRAEEIVGTELWLDKDELPNLDESEYYWLDLDGKTVVTDDGHELGVVTAIFDTGAHDVLNVSGKGREYLVPFHDSFIVRMDENVVVLSLPPGLLDINS